MQAGSSEAESATVRGAANPAQNIPKQPVLYAERGNEVDNS